MTHIFVKLTVLQFGDSVILYIKKGIKYFYHIYIVSCNTSDLMHFLFSFPLSSNTFYQLSRPGIPQFNISTSLSIKNNTGHDFYYRQLVEFFNEREVTEGYIAGY